VLTYDAVSAAPPERVWELLAQPRLWSSWAPHLRGSCGLGSPEVEAGARGTVTLLGALPVPVVISAKRPGRSWTWRVGPVEINHRVEAQAPGSRIAIDLSAPAALEPLLRVSYGPVVALLVRNLARVAAGQR
jgi:hypothetical protein